jgi:hypothetical protein
VDAVPAYRLYVRHHGLVTKTAGGIADVSGRAWWLSAAALLLLLAVAALGVAVTMVDPNDYKPQIVAAVQRATGRTLSLAARCASAARYGRRLR